MAKNIPIVVVILIFHFRGISQINLLIYPKVGNPCPDFTLQNIKHYTKKTASLKDFQGKWLLLDFWNRNCGACIASFPHINEMQKELGDKIQVVMVAIEDPNKEVELIYSKFRVKENLLMPCAFDSMLAHRFDYLITPRLILIDDKGIVQCITNTISKDEVKSFLAGKHPLLPKAYRMHEDIPEQENTVIHFDYKKPFAINSNGAIDTDFIFRSVLFSFKPGVNEFGDFGSIENALASNRSAFSVLGSTLESLYFYAYLGTWKVLGSNYEIYHNELVFETSDSSLFKYDVKTGRNLFCYAINLPSLQATVGRVMGIMQQDLKNYFEFDISIETRKYPCWKLVATKAARAKLRTKGEPELFEGNANVSYIARNIPFQRVFIMIRNLNKGTFFDESGIVGNVDISMGCDGCVLTDVYDVKKALQANGLDLIQSEKEMKVLVVHDDKIRKSRDFCRSSVTK